MERIVVLVARVVVMADVLLMGHPQRKRSNGTISIMRITVIGVDI